MKSNKLPQYESIKLIGALNILDIRGNWIIPKQKEYDLFRVSDEYMQKYEPKVGGYYLRDDDGNESYLPLEKFNGNYFLHDDRYKKEHPKLSAASIGLNPDITLDEVIKKIRGIADDLSSGKLTIDDVVITSTGITYELPTN